MKRLRKVVVRLCVIVFLVITIIAGVIFIQGYQRYKEAIKETPIEQKVQEVIQGKNYVPYEEIDEDFLNAVVAIEDHRFFTRQGVDLIAIGRSLVVNVVSGEIKEGGSTITQQVGKNFYFSHEPSITRKVAEIFLVDDLEAEYSKEEILALYVNIIYYGDGYNGIEAASMGYFGKSASDLTLYEATLLAGLPQSPSRYQLSNGYDLINERQKLVVLAMVKEEMITEQQANEVLAQQP